MSGTIGGPNFDAFKTSQNPVLVLQISSKVRSFLHNNACTNSSAHFRIIYDVLSKESEFPFTKKLAIMVLSPTRPSFTAVQFYHFAYPFSHAQQCSCPWTFRSTPRSLHSRLCGVRLHVVKLDHAIFVAVDVASRGLHPQSHRKAWRIRFFRLRWRNMIAVNTRDEGD